MIIFSCLKLLFEKFFANWEKDEIRIEIPTLIKID